MRRASARVPADRRPSRAAERAALALVRQALASSRDDVLKLERLERALVAAQR